MRKLILFEKDFYIDSLLDSGFKIKYRGTDIEVITYGPSAVQDAWVVMQDKLSNYYNTRVIINH